MRINVELNFHFTNPIYKFLNSEENLAAKLSFSRKNILNLAAISKNWTIKLIAKFSSMLILEILWKYWKRKSLSVLSEGDWCKNKNLDPWSFFGIFESKIHVLAGTY